MANKTCSECRFYVRNRHGGCCTFIGDAMCYDDLACDNFEKPTNGDVIQQMSNAGLAEFLRDAADDIANNNRSKDDVLAWLNAPAESEGEDE